MAYDYIWRSRLHHPERRGQRCRRLVERGVIAEGHCCQWVFESDGFVCMAGTSCGRRIA